MAGNGWSERASLSLQNDEDASDRLFRLKPNRRFAYLRDVKVPARERLDVAHGMGEAA